jgi:hypothetical protein
MYCLTKGAGKKATPSSRHRHNRSSLSNQSVKFVIDFDLAPSIADPNEVKSSMTQNVRSMKTLAIRSELESRGVSTDKFREKNELINALIMIRWVEENTEVVDPFSDPCAPKLGRRVSKPVSLKSYYSNLSTDEGTFSVGDDSSIVTDQAVIMMSKPMSNRIQYHTTSARVAVSGLNSIIGKILFPSKVHPPTEKTMLDRRRSSSREDPNNSVSVTQHSSAYNQAYTIKNESRRRRHSV